VTGGRTSALLLFFGRGGDLGAMEVLDDNVEKEGVYDKNPLRVHQGRGGSVAGTNA